ncbi:uncharacterized protein LOC141880173 [Acropora palmata]|uniref:uncharacterized protein LOC141880173 n=1 Tax=Acropora palmata TaxID=6131 RepID=UPI003DA01189
MPLIVKLSHIFITAHAGLEHFLPITTQKLALFRQQVRQGPALKNLVHLLHGFASVGNSTQLGSYHYRTSWQLLRHSPHCLQQASLQTFYQLVPVFSLLCGPCRHWKTT